MGGTPPIPIAGQARVHAPAAERVRLVVDGGPSFDATRDDDGFWVAEFAAPEGSTYSMEVDGGAPLLDPSCRDLVVTEHGPRSVHRAPWARRPRGAPLAEPPVVYEVHVKGLGGSFLGCIDHLDHIASVGATVVELMPVHPFDTSGNYWGYMPLVWGAVHRGHARDPGRAAEELAELVSAAHARGLHVWLDVVYNHTHDSNEGGPSWGLGGYPGAAPFRRHRDGRAYNDSGCGNDTNVADPWMRELVIESLDRYADLGIDGFRFDLASLLTRDRGGLVSRITSWGAERGVALVAEPWDLGAYQLGHGWPWPTWLQWNDRFRDAVRGLVRGEHGWVRAVRQRVQGSPDLFGPDGAERSLNFVTAHDGLTMHDLTVVTSDRHHSWDCGPALRMQQLKNYFSLLLLSAGTPMWVMGDEFGRTQRGYDNPYNLDDHITWVDWDRSREWQELTEFVRELLALRRRHALVQFRFHGVDEQIDEGFLSHSLAWCTGDLYVMVNAWWEPLTFGMHEPGDWRMVLATAAPEGRTLAPRSVVVWERTSPGSAPHDTSPAVGIRH
jgi:glycogen operon protein